MAKKNLNQLKVQTFGVQMRQFCLRVGLPGYKGGHNEKKIRICHIRHTDELDHLGIMMLVLD